MTPRLKTVRIADLIRHLQTFPPNTILWDTWDESGDCWAVRRMPGCYVNVKRWQFNKHRRWSRMFSEDKGAKRVFMLLEGEQ